MFCKGLHASTKQRKVGKKTALYIKKKRCAFFSFLPLKPVKTFYLFTFAFFSHRQIYDIFHPHEHLSYLQSMFMPKRTASWKCAKENRSMGYEPHCEHYKEIIFHANAVFLFGVWFFVHSVSLARVLPNKVNKATAQRRSPFAPLNTVICMCTFCSLSLFWHRFRGYYKIPVNRSCFALIKIQNSMLTYPVAH